MPELAELMANSSNSSAELPELAELVANSSNSSVQGLAGIGGQHQQRPRSAGLPDLADKSGDVGRSVWSWVTTAETGLSNCIQVFEKTLLTLACGTMQNFGKKPSKS